MKRYLNNKAVNIVATSAFAITLFVFLLSFAISLPILNRWFYYIQIKTLGLEELSGRTYAEIKAAYDQMLDYLLLPGKDFGTGVFAYSQEGAAHFADCKVLFVLDLVLAGSCGAIALILFVLHCLKIIRLNSLAGRSAAFWTAVAAIVFPLILGAAIAADFDSAFEIFHKIFFPGKDNWIFDSRYDEIIQVLPEEFFMNCAIFIGAGLVFFSAAIITADLVSAHIVKKRKSAGKNSAQTSSLDSENSNTDCTN